jgi:FAD synthetase
MKEESGDPLTRKILSQLYLRDLVREIGQSGFDASPIQLGSFQHDDDLISRTLSEMIANDLITRTSSSDYALLPKGRRMIKVVMAGGTFDIVHPGHIETLKKAKSLGDVLIVSVARDKTVQKNKGRAPLHDERLRHELVSSVRYVDCAVLGSLEDIFETLRIVSPDIVALGYDQHHTEESVKRGAEERGLTIDIIRLDSTKPGLKSSSILSGKAAEITDSF